MEMPKKLYTFAVHYFQEYGKTLEKFLDEYFPSADFGPRATIGLNREDHIGAADPALRVEI
jgi:hypothetical protein